MVADLEPVQLQDQHAVGQQLFVLVAAVAAAGAEHLLIPGAGLRDVDDGEHGLWSYGRNGHGVAR